MYSNNKLAKSVRLALMFGASATAAISANAFAADEVVEEEEVERIEVTGSRIKRTDLEGASPVTVMTAEDIKIEGNFTVADALRSSSFNSFGSFSERSGSSAQSQATVNLRGAGSNRTLVLLDGKRMPGSPTLGGQSANLNSIPFAAVERIEILTDGASSTYGSDAIAGVVNIILKKNYEGLEFNVGAGQRSEDEGTTSSEFSVLGGYSTDKGNITFAFDHQKRLGISDGARSYTAAKMTDFDGDGNIQAYAETDGWSIYGSTVAAPDFSSAMASTTCDDKVSEFGEGTFKKVSADSDWSPGSTYCMYAYANVSYNTASIDRNTLFVDANYEIADGVEWFGRAMFVQNSSFGRYAPPAAPWRNMGYENPENPYGISNDEAGFYDAKLDGTAFEGNAWSPMFQDNNGDYQYYNYDSEGKPIDSDIQRVDEDGAPVFDEDGNPVYVPAVGAYDPMNAYQNTTGYYRWTGIGTRDGNVDDYSQDYLTGFRGELDWGNATWEVYYHKNIADNKSVGEYYLSYGGLAHNIANDIDLASEEGVANMKATTLQNSASSFDQYNFGIGFDLFELPAGAVAHFFGGEYMEQTYADIYDGQSETGLIGGSAGNSAKGERDITAFFYEAAIPVTDSIEVNLAARYDDYSDFGDNIAPKASVRWEILDGLVLRASYSESFRAPGLDELNAATTFSAESAIDYAAGDTAAKQFDTYYKSNPDLGAETSEYTNIGVAWDITDDMGVKFDYFNLAIDDVISTKTVQSLLTDEAQGEIKAVAPGTDVSDETFYLIRTLDGKLLEAGTGYFNGGTLNIEGLDVTFNAGFETGFGDFRFNTINSFIFDYGDEYNYAGTEGAPDFKSVTTFGWALGDFSAAWTMNYTDSTYENSYVDSDTLDLVKEGELDSWLIHNVSFTYDAGDFGALTLQVVNLTNEDPVLNSFGQWTDQNLYNNFGRDYRANYTIKF
ncbi:TonB-dependent receptor domain-containing protein [Thalassotalea litorea]|uniref:TonB-dependent receptor domain-containing protein n=1 Tax=Thalassotalea litorea TaxID=2020715 RepID=UPI003736FB25